MGRRSPGAKKKVVKAYTSEEEKAKIIFQNGDVRMPILSVA
jgi:hypothetical protein